MKYNKCFSTVNNPQIKAQDLLGSKEEEKIKLNKIIYSKWDKARFSLHNVHFPVQA